MLEEELLNYVGSMILGLNDALVELTGALTGFTFAFRDTKLIALSGLITGISASLSMSASEYLSHRASGKEKQGRKSRTIHWGRLHLHRHITHFAILAHLQLHLGSPAHHVDGNCYHPCLQSLYFCGQGSEFS